MNTIRFVLLFSFLLLASCKENSNPTNVQRDYGSLTQSWTNSIEEQSDSVQVYRPSSYKEFPAARFREVLVFTKDSSCSYLVLSPTDAHYMQQGRWSMISPNRVTILDTSLTIYKTIEILELKQDLLRCVDVN